MAARRGESRAAGGDYNRCAMAASARSFNLVRERKNAYNHRLRLVESAKQRGIQRSTRLFATTVPTVRKWLRRYEQRGPSGLVELSRARHQQSLKTPPTTAAQLVELRKTLPTFGARRLIREFDLPIGHCALERIWREQGLMEKRRRNYQRKQDLAHIKASWALFQQISADTKDLDDIPRYWLQAQRLRLPVIQYTAREIRSGLLFWTFAQQRSASASAVLASRIQQHLDRYGRSIPISSSSTSCVLTPTKKIRAPGKSSSGSLPARRSNSACSRPSPWMTTSTTPGDTMCPGFPSGSGPRS
jgi:transposase